MCWAAGVSALKFSHQHIMNYFPLEGDILITNPITLLLIYSGHFEFQVSKYLPFSCWLPKIKLWGVKKTKQNNRQLLSSKLAIMFSVVAVFPAHCSAFSSQHLSKHITFSCVSATTARPHRSVV